MENKDFKNITINQILQWNENKNINPLTGRKIKENGDKYKLLEKKYYNIFADNYNYYNANSRDPVSLVDIWIETNGKKEFVYKDHLLLIFYSDEKGNYNTFELDTINYFIKYNINKHPITFLPIPDEVFRKIDYIEPIVHKTIKERTLDIFQIFTNISIFIDFEEFLKLDTDKLSKLYYETNDFFHQNLPKETIILIKQSCEDKKIYELSLEDYNKLTLEKKQKYILNCFEILLNYKDETIKCMSYYIILGGLSLFIPKIKNDYPDFCFNFNV